MSFLDTYIAARNDMKFIDLHEILIRAYPNRADAFAIAGTVGILQADIEDHPKTRYTWWSVLDEAAKDKKLRWLIYNVLHDPTVSAIHNDIRSLLDIPESELNKSLGPLVHRNKAACIDYLNPTIGDRASLWPLGYVIKVRFLDGNPELQYKVEQIAQQWVIYTNLQFDFGDHRDAEVRISFKWPGSWSIIGRCCLQISDPEPTLNLGGLTTDTASEEIQRVVLHEFGHVLGMQHEQGNPTSPLKWDKEAIYQAMTEPSNCWTKSQVDQQFFKIWPPGYYPVYKVYDPESITMFPIPAMFLKEGKAIGWNKELTPLDKQFAAALYPQRK